jgi:cytochrome b pre-mRNA-processing protein 3
MFSWFKRASGSDAAAQKLYGAIVDQARQPHFYRELGVPDTYEGRFELIALHMALVVDRLSQAGEDGQQLGRALNEVFVTDMDDNLREIGVGDLTVPKKVKKAAAAVFDRARSLRAAFAEGDNKALEAVLAVVHIDGATTQASRATDQDLADFARYVRSAGEDLKVTPDADLLAGRCNFPAPAVA